MGYVQKFHDLLYSESKYKCPRVVCFRIDQVVSHFSLLKINDAMHIFHYNRSPAFLNLFFAIIIINNTMILYH